MVLQWLTEHVPENTASISKQIMLPQVETSAVIPGQLSQEPATTNEATNLQSTTRKHCSVHQIRSGAPSNEQLETDNENTKWEVDAIVNHKWTKLVYLFNIQNHQIIKCGTYRVLLCIRSSGVATLKSIIHGSLKMIYGKQ